MLKGFKPIIIVAGDPKSIFLEIYFKSLKKIYLSKSSLFEKDHVTPKLINSPFFKKEIKRFYSNYSFVRLTVDEKKDLKTVDNVLKFLSLSNEILFVHNQYF